MKHNTNTIILKILPALIALAAVTFVLSSCGSSGPGGAATTTFPQNRYDFPTDITPSPDNTKLFVANNVRNSISIYEPSSLNKIGEINVTCAPRRVIINSAGTEMYVAHDNATNCKLSPLDPTIYNGNKVSIVNLTTGLVTKELTFLYNHNFRNMLWNEDLHTLYLTAFSADDYVYVIDTDTQEIIKSISGLSDPLGMDMTSDGSTVVVAAAGDKKLALIDTSTNAQYTGSPWSTSCTTPTSVVISNDDNYVFLTCNGSDKVYVYDISNPEAGTATLLGYTSVGDQPTAMHLTDDGNWLLVVNKGSGTLYSIPWNLLKLGGDDKKMINGLSFQIGASASDLAVIGDTAYITDQLSSTIYKINFKDTNHPNFLGSVQFAAQPFSNFPY